MQKMTKEQAKRFIITYQGLGADGIYKGKQGALDFISQAGCIQYDTLNIVGRNPDLVLQARIKNYKASMLNELLYKDRLLLDEWDKEMSIYPTADWPFFERNRKAAFERYGEIIEVKDCLQSVRELIDSKGPVTSSDLGLDQAIDWSWAPTRLSRAILESMYLWGELIVYDKAGARKLYDFAAKHLPLEIFSSQDPNKSLQQYHQWHVLRRIGAVGLLWNKAGDAWLGIKEMKAKERSEAIDALLEQKQIIEVRVDALKYPLYMKSSCEGLLQEILEQKSFKGAAAFLAPLDNMLWDRKLIQELFDFEYRWEVYKPAAQRKYGYYVLPVLYGDSFVARFEPVLDKENKVLKVKNWWWEPGVKVTAKMRRDLQSSLERFAAFAEMQKVGNDIAEF